MNKYLIQGNATRIPLESESVQCIILSSPYFRLRSYTTEERKNQEIGSEELHDCLGWATANFCGECFVCHTLEWAREAHRVLRNDGVMFFNIGDTYNGSGGSGGDYNEGGMRDGQPKFKGTHIDNLKPKDLIGIPWHVAFALQYDGWYLRNEIIWHKPNAMPEGGARDRCGRDHEQVFLFSKSNKYYFDIDAIREPNQTLDAELNRKNFFDVQNYEGDQDAAKENGVGKIRKDRVRSDDFNILGRKKRTVWSINTVGTSGSHFAKFPPELVDVCIKGGTSEYGCCSNCGAPYKRIVERTFDGEYNDKEGLKQRERMYGVAWGGLKRVTLGRTENVSNKTIGWERTCDCLIQENYHGDPTAILEEPQWIPYPVIPCTVLDPFVGSGTTLLVARQLKRNAIGLDLSFHYLNNDAKNRLGITARNEWLEKVKVNAVEEKSMFDN